MLLAGRLLEMRRQPYACEVRLSAPGLRRWPSLPADGVFDLSMRLTAGFAQRLLHPRGLLSAAFATWAQLAARRRASM